ncbi:MAG: molybdopterin-dependent oxidoreductase [Steroidobacteraceae bacterium]
MPARGRYRSGDSWSARSSSTSPPFSRFPHARSRLSCSARAIPQCAGNPATPRVPARLIANVLWEGVELATLLEAAGIAPQARFVWASGLDRGEFLGVKSGPYLKDLPIERARSQDVLLAYRMNGEPLTAEHGYPVRLVVPGYYGTNSVKWLYRVEVAGHRAGGPFTTTFYNDEIESAGAAPSTQPVWSVPPEAIIVSPAVDVTIPLGPAGESITVWGWAWADAGIARVEVSVDVGRSWSTARVGPRSGPTWQRFEIEWTPALEATQTEGETELWCRATDAEGRIQPLAGARNAVHRVPVRLRRAS